MLRVEEFGAAASDPTGRWILFERKRPYDEFGDYSFRNYATSKSGHQIWRFDLARRGSPELLPGIAPKPHSYLGAFSPSGQFLSVMQYHFGKLSLSAYNMQTESTVTFSRTPAFGRAGKHNPVWITDHEIVYTALPDNTQPEATSVRAYTGQQLLSAWWDAWRGNTVTSSVLSSPSASAWEEQEPGSLIRADALSGKERVIGNGLYADLRISPDRAQLAALSVSKPGRTRLGSFVSADPRKYRLTIFDLQSGEAVRLAPELEFFPYSIAWSHDSRKVAAFGWQFDEDVRQGRFYVFETSNGNIARYDHNGLELASERERGWLQRPERTFFLGNQLIVFGRRVGGNTTSPQFSYQDVSPKGLGRADWYSVSPEGATKNLTGDLGKVSAVPIHSTKDHFTIATDAGVYRIHKDGSRRRLSSYANGTFKFVPPGTFATRSNVIRPDFSDSALFKITGEVGVKLVMIDLRDGHENDALVVDSPEADATPLAGSLADEAILFTVNEAVATKLFVAGRNDGDSIEVASINEHLQNVDLGRWQSVSYEVDSPGSNAASRTLSSCVLIPPRQPHGTPPPLVVEVYPGVRNCDARRSKISHSDFNSPYLWAARGFAYVRMSTPQDLMKTNAGPIDGIDELIDAGVKAIVDEGIADPNRLLLYGFSQGGVSSLFVAAKSAHFRAVIAMNSWADFFSHYFGPAGVYSYIYGDFIGAESVRYDAEKGSLFSIGDTPFENPEIFYRNSPVFMAPQIDAPVMLIHSDMDSFSMSQFDEMFGALKRAGKEARYVRYWGEGHGPSSPANIRDMWQRIDDFLSEHGVAP